MIASILMILVDQNILVIKPQRWRATRLVPHRLLLVPRRVASHPLFAPRWCISAVHITEDRKETGKMHDKQSDQQAAFSSIRTVSCSLPSLAEGQVFLRISNKSAVVQQDKRPCGIWRRRLSTLSKFNDWENGAVSNRLICSMSSPQGLLLVWFLSMEHDSMKQVNDALNQVPYSDELSFLV